MGKLRVNRACKLIKVRRQGYYEYLSGRDSASKTADRQLMAKIKNNIYRAIVSMGQGKPRRNCAMEAIG